MARTKEEIKAIRAAYHAANREKRAAASAAYKAATKDKQGAARAVYCVAAPEKATISTSRYSPAKEKQRLIMLALNKLNREKRANAAHAEKVKAAAKAKAWGAANKEKVAAYSRFRNTGVTQEQYDGAYLKQKGVCAICSGVEASGKRLAADHCHTTGVFRGLLCMKCNTAIGKLNDDAVLVKKALNYLKETQCSQKVLIS
jgi:hypothetical protein